MKRFTVYGTMSASVKIGEYEADTKEEAIDMADKDKQANWNPSLCWHCSQEIELGEVYETQAVEE